MDVVVSPLHIPPQGDIGAVIPGCLLESVGLLWYI